MDRSISVLACLACLCVSGVFAAASCDQVLDCHLGITANDLKTWINHKLACNCVVNPSCTCGGHVSLELCKDARTIALIRAPQNIKACDKGLGTLRDRIYTACKNIDQDVGKFLNTDRACAQQFHTAETIYSTIYAVVAILAYFGNARNIGGWASNVVSYTKLDLTI